MNIKVHEFMILHLNLNIEKRAATQNILYRIKVSNSLALLDCDANTFE